VQNVHSAGISHKTDALTGNTHGQVGTPIPVKVAGGQGEAEQITAVRPVRDVWDFLVPKVGAYAKESGGGTIQNIHSTSIALALDPLSGNTYSQVIVAISVEVAGG
jgi:hypothetical protein